MKQSSSFKIIENHKKVLTLTLRLMLRFICKKCKKIDKVFYSKGVLHMKKEQ